MDMLENQGTQRRRKPSVKVLVLAAALAVGCVLSIAAGLPAQVYHFLSGGTMTVLPGTNQAFFEFIGEGPSPVVLKDGRVLVEADGEQIDITDKVDENTPYIAEHTDPATGNKGYLVVGGPAEDLGWVELVQFGDTCAISGDNFALPGSISLDDLQDIHLAEDGSYVVDDDEPAMGGKLGVIDSPVYRPWLQAALDQLGLDMKLGLVD